MNKHLIAGTAGHIDHGKTTLIRALTGIETDRLKEEKERGITIELGFAHLALPGGSTLGIVDVPGHERFVRHMVAGAVGIDLVMLVIAADEGIMPQTREHLDICRLLGIRRGVVVLTKRDMVDDEWLELVTAEVAGFVRGTFLEQEPIIPVSGTTGQGIPELLAELDRLVGDVRPRPPWGIFRMPVDRVFTMRGFGTVVTGTTVSGSVRVGETVRVYPGELETKVRGLQVHNASVAEAEAGTRTAVNLQGVEKEQIGRGNVVGIPGQLTPSFILDVRLELLPSAKPLETRQRVRFHLGTAEILGRVHLLENDILEPGQEGLAQVRLEEPTVALARDRFVLRSYSPSVTLGGGAVIDPTAPKLIRRKGRVAATIVRLVSLEKGSPEESVLAALQAEGPGGGTVTGLSRALNLDESDVTATLESLASRGAVARIGNGNADPVLHGQVLGDLRDAVTGLLRKFHNDNPLKAGLSREELKTKLPRDLHPRILTALMEGLEKDKIILAEGKLVRLAAYRVQLDQRQQALRERLEALLRDAGLAVPSPDELAAATGSRKPDVVSMLGLLVNERALVKINDEIFLPRERFEELSRLLDGHFARSPELTVGDFKEMTGLTRKYVIPVLEYFDRHGVTLRVGDRRMARAR